MKLENITLVSLNTAAHRFSGIDEFLRDQKGAVDIFCLQDTVSSFVHPHYPKSLHRTIPFHSDDGAKVNDHLIRKTLDGFSHYFSPHQDFLETFALEGNMMSVREISELRQQITFFDFGSHDVFAFQDRAINVVIQWVVINGVVIAHLHGLWENSIKEDTLLKLEQSKRIVKWLDHIRTRFSLSVVLAGDFNLLPHTESIYMIQHAGLRNLITHYDIHDTRTSHYQKKLRHADYIFVSNDIIVHDFHVMPDVVSDHAPLRLTFSA